MLLILWWVVWCSLVLAGFWCLFKSAIEILEDMEDDA